MTNPSKPFHLPLTEEQQEMIHKMTGEHAFILELMPEEGDATSGEGRGLKFNWRISVDSGIPRQQWNTGARKPAADEGASA